MLLYILSLLCGGLVTQGASEGISDVWLSPKWDESVVNGSSYDITWTSDFASWFPTYCPSCDTDKVDLCVQPFSTRNWNINLARGININERLRYSWTINIPAEEVRDANDLVLRFIPFQGSCDGDEEVSSPRFSIKAAPASSATPTPTSQSAAASTPSSSTSTDVSEDPTASLSATEIPTASASPANAGLSTGAKAGIGVGVGLAAVLLLSALLLPIKVKRSRAHAQSWHDQRTSPEKEIASHHSGAYQDGPQQGSSWPSPHEMASSAGKSGGLSDEHAVQELDGRNVISEVHGGHNHP